METMGDQRHILFKFISPPLVLRIVHFAATKTESLINHAFHEIFASRFTTLGVLCMS